MATKSNQRILIELKNVKKHYFMGDNVVKAVDGITLEVKEKEFVAIMGPSGSGKSTAMHLTFQKANPRLWRGFMWTTQEWVLRLFSLRNTRIC